jgi:hypothetical protein
MLDARSVLAALAVAGPLAAAPPATQPATTAPDDGDGEAASPSPHPDFRQIIPRGRIASVDEPVFVKAGEAEIEGDAWVLGVEADGSPRAYSLRLLNRHEVVNDRAGERTFAAVW